MEAVVSLQRALDRRTRGRREMARKKGSKQVEMDLRLEIDTFTRQARKKDRQIEELRAAVLAAQRQTARMGVAFKKARDHAEEQLEPLYVAIEVLEMDQDVLEEAVDRGAALIGELRKQLAEEKAAHMSTSADHKKHRLLSVEAQRKMRSEMDENEAVQRLRLSALTKDLEEAEERLVAKPGRADLESSLRAVRQELGDMSHGQIQLRVRNEEAARASEGAGAEGAYATPRRARSAATSVSPYAEQLDGPSSPMRNSPPRNRTRLRAGAAQRSALATSPYLEGARRDRRERDVLASRVETLERKLAKEAHRRRRAEERVHILTGIENELTDAESADMEDEGSGDDDNGIDDGGFAFTVRVGSPLAGATRSGFGPPTSERRPGSRGERRPSSTARERRPSSRGDARRAASSKQDDGRAHTTLLPAIGVARVSSSSSSVRSSR